MNPWPPEGQSQGAAPELFFSGQIMADYNSGREPDSWPVQIRPVTLAGIIPQPE